MKKTVQKAIQKLSFSDQLKSTPKEIKMFFAGLLVIVAAIAFVLPNISGKMLQGNVLNAKSSVNGYGYGYGYGNDNGTRFGYGYVPLGQCFLIETDKETKISCPKKGNGNITQKDIALQDGYGYGFGYGSDGTRGYFSFNIKNVGNVAIKENLEKLVWQLSINGVNQSNVPGYTLQLNDNRPSQQNNLVINPGQTSTVNGIIRLSTGRLEQNSYISFNLDYPEQDQNLGNNRISIVLNKIPNQSINNNICQIPENVLACSLKLNTCPQQCRLEVCKTPENTLACSLKLDTCPVECKYDGTTPPAVNCQSPMNVLACALGLDSCPVECRDTGTNTGTVTKDLQITSTTLVATDNKTAILTVNIKNIGTEKIKIAGILPEFFANGSSNQLVYSATTPLHDIQEIAAGQTDYFSSTYTLLEDVFTYTSFAKVSVFTDGDQNMDNNYMKAYLTGNIKSAPTTGSTTTRTPWLDRDNQSGAGDYETYKDFTVAPCGSTDNVVSSRYEAIDGKAHSDLKLHVDRLNVYCVNAENNNRCVDYKIQYECKN